MWVDLRAGDSPTLRRLHELVMANLGVIRTEFGTFIRQVSGYSLEHLLPERRFDVPKFFAGTEGTLGVIVRATVRLVADAPHRLMVALGRPEDDFAVALIEGEESGEPQPFDFEAFKKRKRAEYEGR